MQRVHKLGAMLIVAGGVVLALIVWSVVELSLHVHSKGNAWRDACRNGLLWLTILGLIIWIAGVM